jgi:NitT/TauT family transport system substrate-binding protein
MARRRLPLFAAAVALALVPTPSLADPFKLKIACTATIDCASAMVARDQGIFAKHGLDADVTLIGTNTNTPRRSRRT